jgi:hypothetical protein
MLDLTAWKAKLVRMSSQSDRMVSLSIRVGEALTKDRKSSAFSREGLLEAMVRIREGAMKVLERRTKKMLRLVDGSEETL